MTELQEQVIPVSFASGIDTKTDARSVDAAKLLVLQNGYMQTPKKVRKRPGYGYISGQSAAQMPYTGNAGVFPYKNELVVIPGSSQPVTFTPNVTNGFTQVLGNVYIPCKVTQSNISSVSTPANDSNQTNQDSAYDPVSNTQCFTWVYNGSLYYSLINYATGARIVANASVAETVNYGKVVVFQNKFVLIWWNASTHHLRYSTLTPVGVFAAAADLATDMATTAGTANFDCFVSINSNPSLSRIYVGYNLASSGGTQIFYLDTSFAKTSSTLVTSHVASKALTLFLDNANTVVWYAISDGTDVWCGQMSWALAATNLAATVVAATAGVTQLMGLGPLSTICELIFCAFTTGATTNVVSGYTMTQGGTPTSFFAVRSLSLVSKLFNLAGTFCYVGMYGGTLQPTYFLMAANSVVGKIAASFAYDYARTSHLPSVPLIGSVAQLANPHTVGAADGGVVAATYATYLDPTATIYAAELSNTLHISGAQLWAYDGIQFVEHGFHLQPDSLAHSSTGSSTIAAGTYQAMAVYEWTDAQGQAHRSAPSLPNTITVSGGGVSSITWTCSSLRVTQKGVSIGTHINSPVTVSFFRTAAGGTIFFFIGSVVNDITADTVSFTDTNTDAAIAGNLQLYTTSGEVPNSSAPSCQLLAIYAQRLIVVPSETPYQWWFSKQVISASAATTATPVEFSNQLITSIDQLGGAIVDIAAMDDKLLSAKATTWFYTVGNGPTINGLNNDFSTAQNVTSIVGVAPGTRAAVVENGLLFQAPNGAGIWLMTRGLTQAYVGADVEAYNAQSLVQSVVVPSQNHVRFFMSGGATLVYDYYLNAWSVYSLADTVGAVCLYSGLFTFITSSGFVMQETPLAFTDLATPVSMTITTSWLKTAGIGGFQRLRRLLITGDYKSAHRLTVSIAYDYGSATQTVPFTLASAPSIYEFLIAISHQKCSAIQITLQDSNSTGTGEAFDLSALTFEAGVKKGVNKIPANRRYG